MSEMVDIAESPGQDPPRKGHGRACARKVRERTEGYYERVTQSGCEPDTPMTEQLRHAHDRNAVRKGEVQKDFGRKSQKKISGNTDADNVTPWQEAPLQEASWQEAPWAHSRGWGFRSQQACSAIAAATWATAWQKVRGKRMAKGRPPPRKKMCQRAKPPPLLQ